MQLVRFLLFIEPSSTAAELAEKRHVVMVHTSSRSRLCFGFTKWPYSRRRTQRRRGSNNLNNSELQYEKHVSFPEKRGLPL